MAQVSTHALTEPTNTFSSFYWRLLLVPAVRVWDVEAGMCLKVHAVGHAIHRMVVCKASPEQGYLIIDPESSTSKASKKEGGGQKEGNEKKWRLIAYDWASDTNVNTIFKTKGACTGLACLDAADGSSDNSVVAFLKGKSLMIYEHIQGQPPTVTKHKHIYRLTAVAIHPQQKYVATGDAKGQITLWYCLGQDQTKEGESVKKVVTSKLHWHAHAVTCLSFSSDGTLMLSGGEEGVLVMWQVATGKQSFLPRLGAPLSAISVSSNSQFYTLSCTDNSVRLFNSLDLKQQWKMQGLAIAHEANAANATRSIDSLLRTGLVIDPRQQALVLNGKYGSATLQFFNVNTHRHISELPVLHRNPVSRTDSKDAALFQVEHVCFNSTGSSMVTADSSTAFEDWRFGQAKECSLKFWEYSVTLQQHILTAQVERPHDSEISAVACHPTLPLVATGSSDQTFKLWSGAMEEETESSAAAEKNAIAAKATEKGATSTSTTKGTPSGGATKSRLMWSCGAVGAYRKKPVGALAFSTDGSILAAAFGQVVTLWEPFSNTLKSLLVHPPADESVTRLGFVPDSPLLVAATDRTLYVWNILTAEVWWSYRAKVTSLAVENMSGGFVPSGQARFAILVNDLGEGGGKGKPSCFVVLFDANSPVPLHIWRLGTTAKSLVFLPRSRSSKSDSNCTLLLVDSNCELYHLQEDNGADEDADEAIDEMDEEGADAGDEDRPPGLTPSVAATTFKKMFATTVIKQHGRSKHLQQQQQQWEEQQQAQILEESSPFFQSPSHLIPQVSSLYHSFMGQALQKSTTGDAGTIGESDSSSRQTEKGEPGTAGGGRHGIEDKQQNSASDNTFAPMLDFFSSSFGGAKRARPRSGSKDKSKASAAVHTTPGSASKPPLAKSSKVPASSTKKAANTAEKAKRRKR
jgi:NET1-associated nuclear protein 1 (U3 small nucleolar RNA-associated protein 17)